MDIVATYQPFRWTPVAGRMADARPAAGAAPVERVVEGELLGRTGPTARPEREWTAPRGAAPAGADARRALAAYLSNAAAFEGEKRRRGRIDCYA